jgi:hypothetical protein
MSYKDIPKFFIFNFSQGMGYVILPTFDPCIFCGGDRDICACCIGCGATVFQVCTCQEDAEAFEAARLVEWEAEEKARFADEMARYNWCITNGIDPLGVCDWDEHGHPF